MMTAKQDWMINKLMDEVKALVNNDKEYNRFLNGLNTVSVGFDSYRMSVEDASEDIKALLVAKEYYTANPYVEQEQSLRFGDFVIFTDDSQEGKEFFVDKNNEDGTVNLVQCGNLRNRIGNVQISVLKKSVREEE